MRRATYCACGHDGSRHLAGGGSCAVTLPPFEDQELPAWSCPCRRFVASGLASVILRSVQSCTVLAADQGERRNLPTTRALLVRRPPA